MRAHCQKRWRPVFLAGQRVACAARRWLDLPGVPGSAHVAYTARCCFTLTPCLFGRVRVCGPRWTTLP